MIALSSNESPGRACALAQTHRGVRCWHTKSMDEDDDLDHIKTSSSAGYVKWTSIRTKIAHVIAKMLFRDSEKLQCIVVFLCIDSD